MRGQEGTQFLVDFEALKSATSDSPEVLDEQWRDREDLKGLCDRLNRCRFSFDIAEEWTAVAFTPHVPAAAAKARRDFDARWRQVVARIADREILAQFDHLFLDDFADEVDEQTDPLSRDIENWKYLAKEDASNLTYAFSCLADQRANDEWGDFEWVDDAQSSWDRLTKVVGLDLKGAFWRRRAIPHVLFPSHVSKRYGPDHASIYRRLFDAARAFTFGAPLAALAMQRSVLEQLLERHWGAERGHPGEADFNDQSQSSRAHRLWRFGNAALHREIDQLKTDELEREVIKNFLLLRELIEQSPEKTQHD